MEKHLKLAKSGKVELQIGESSNIKWDYDLETQLVRLKRRLDDIEDEEMGRRQHRARQDVERIESEIWRVRIEEREKARKIMKEEISEDTSRPLWSPT